MQWCEIDKDDAIGKFGGRRHGHRNRQPGLTDPSRTGEGHQPHILSAKKRLDGRERSLAANETGKRVGRAHPMM